MPMRQFCVGTTGEVARCFCRTRDVTRLWFHVPVYETVLVDDMESFGKTEGQKSAVRLGT